MADYWKSQPKKFCDYCKCWIADNKPSIEFHERGKNHKENVAKKISEIKKKSLDKAKEEEKMSKEFAAMEEAAMKAYQEDLKRLGVKAESVGSAPKKQEEKQEKKAKKKKQFKTPQTSSDKTKEWVQGFSPEGYLYYYNTISRESQWEKPEGFENNPQESQMPGHWVEGVNEEGHTYFYNTVTGVSTWEKPDGLVSSSSESYQEGNHTEEALKADPEGSESEARRGSSQSEPPKPQQNVQKTECDGEKKPSRPKKISPYGKWQAVNPESIEHKEEAAAPPPARKSQASSAPAKPFGEWEEITEEEDPYEKVDLELPSTEGDVLPAPVLEEPDDARIIFKEKTVTSVSDTTGGVSVFKKRKFENGKTRNIRQRLDDS